MDCIFCKIVSGEIPSEKVYESDKVIAFKDINPMAPVHILIIPKEHIGGVDELNESNAGIVKDIMLVAKHLAETLKTAGESFQTWVKTAVKQCVTSTSTYSAAKS